MPVSSARRALFRILFQMFSPTCRAFFPAFSRAPVILSIPLITWSRLIFLPMPLTLWVSLSAVFAAVSWLALRPFRAISVSLAALCMLSMAAAIC